MATLRFDGKVALITGAGGGLGREYALLLALRGASIVVNDLGGDRAGGGSGSKLADETVRMIRAKGGTAVANYNSVEDGDKVVQTAIDTFGRIDILINNAGILRDRSFTNMTETDWDLVHRVHLRGSFLVTRAAWPYMKKQKYGRVIMTSSPAGLYGNFGQANYSAAKLGLVGLSNTLAIEGMKYNILCNTIAPTAYSRLTSDLFPPEAELHLKSEYVAPVVAFLCHESFTDTAGIYETAGGWVTKVKVLKGEGCLVRKRDKLFTPEDVRDHWDEICDMSKTMQSGGAGEATASIMATMESLESSDDTSFPKPGSSASLESAIGKKATYPPFIVTPKDVILYALGVGSYLTKSDKSEIKYLYELHPEFSALPTYGVIPPQSAMHQFVMSSDLGELHPANMLHGEQYLEIYKPIPTDAKLICHAEVADIVDKGSGAVVILNVTVNDDKGEPVCLNQYVVFIVGAGRFGGKKSSPHLKPLGQKPNRSPDVVMKTKTDESQAALYRLSGDYNPLHIDPDFAAVGGFSDPILHGLCVFGVAGRNILKQFAGNDPSKFKAVKARFARPVFPGQTIQTSMWREGNRIHFECQVVESGDISLTGGYVDLTDVVTTSGIPREPQKHPEKKGGDVKSDVLFEEVKKRVEQMPDLVKKVRALYLWNITKDGKTISQWTVDLKTPPGSVYQGTPKNSEKPGCTLTISDDDFIAMASGQTTAQKAFFGKKLKISGNIMLSQKLGQLFQAKAKL